MVELSNFVPVGRGTDSHTSVTILAYELGDLAKCLHYASIREGRERAAYLAEARLAICDLVTVCRRLSQDKSWDWDKLVFDGEERFIERMEDARKLASKKS